MISTTSSYILATIIIIIVAFVYYSNKVTNDNNDKQKDNFNTELKCGKNRIYTMQEAVDTLTYATKSINDNIDVFNSINHSENWIKYKSPIVDNPKLVKDIKDLRTFLDELMDFAASINDTIQSKGKMDRDDAVKLYNKYKKYEVNDYRDHNTPFPSLPLTPAGAINEKIFRIADNFKASKITPLIHLGKTLYDLGGPVMDIFSHSIRYLGCTLRKIDNK